MTVFETANTTLSTVFRRRGMRQFVKFCIVGASSTLIDFGAFLLLMQVVGMPSLVGSLVLARLISASISFLLAVSNGFVWNSRWTFRPTGPASTQTRYAKFLATNAVGLVLNLLILSVVAHSVPHSLAAAMPGNLDDPAGFIGKVCATAVVVFWNFTVNKYWTFKN
jgi:putative flippase GtrA